MKSIRVVGAVGATVALLGTVAVQTASAAPAAVCSSLTTPIYQVVDPKGGSALLTPWSGEAAKAARYGFTQNRGAVFAASLTAGSGLLGVHRLHRSDGGQDFMYTTSTREVGKAAAQGYTDEGVRFYVAAPSAGCGLEVPRLVKGRQHRNVVAAAEVSAMTGNGWAFEGVKFAAGKVAGSGSSQPAPTPDPAPAPGQSGSSFEFAVVPDTQLEVLKANDVRLAQRNQWLVKQNVAFVAQTGDLINWDTSDHVQAVRAKAGMDVLHDHSTPYTVAVGNHDTAATAPGGSAAAGKTWELVRDTRTLNRYFSAADFGNVAGAFEPGKIDNVYATYQAGGKKFMVITLEFAPRKAAVAWAARVVAAHPDDNVIISTHYYLNGNNTIAASNGGYGDASGTYIWKNLVSKYSNIKMVFSGHVGYAAKARVDTGVHGNKVYSFLTTFHEGTTNPVRMLTVDTAKGTVSSTIYAPFTGKTYTAYDQTITGIDFV